MLDKQYRRTIRWINRAQSMSANGKYSDAIMDVECARAELDDARQELLLCHKSGVEQKNCMGFKLSLMTAFCVILLAASPVQMSLIPQNTATVSLADKVPENKDVSAGEVKDLPLPEFAAESSGAVSEEHKRKMIVLNDENKIASLPELQKTGISRKLSEKDVSHLVEVGRKALRQNKSSIVLELN